MPTLSPPAPPTTASFPFLALPAELRTLIYINLLVSPLAPTDRPVARKTLLAALARAHAPLALPSPTSTATPSSRLPYHLYPAVLATCRAIHTEASPLLYTANTFTAHPSLLTALPSFLDDSRRLLAPGVVSRRRIRRWAVTVRLDTDARFDVAKLKDAFDGVEELCVTATEAMYRSAGLHNVLMFAEVRGVRRARVQGSIDGKVAEWLERAMCAEEGVEAPPLDDWISNSMTMYGGVLSDRERGREGVSGDGGAAAQVGTRYNAWAHGNR